MHTDALRLKVRRFRAQAPDESGHARYERSDKNNASCSLSCHLVWRTPPTRHGIPF
jgi:hypothetical protein